MADNQTIFDAPQSVEPEDLSVQPSSDAPLDVEGYEPPPTDGGDDYPEQAEGGLPIRLIALAAGGLLLLVLIIVFIVRFLSSGRPSGDITLKYWGLWESEEVMQTLIDEYQDNHKNITVEYEMQSPIEYRERLQAAIARGEGPDIFRFHNTWVPMLRSELAAVPEDVFTSKELSDSYPPVVSRDLLSDGKFRGVPLMIDGLMLYYNKDMLDEIGASPPSNWEAFEEVATALTVKDGFGSIERAGAAMGTAENVEHFSDILGLLLYQNGTNFNNLASTEARTALEFYSFFAQAPANIWDGSMENSIVAFTGEKVAMIFAPSWQVFTIQAMNPGLNFDTAPVPQIAGGDPANWATYWVEGVSAKSANQDAAFEFLEFLSSKDSLEKLYQASVAEGRAFGEPYPRLDMLGAIEDVQYVGPIAAQAPTMYSWYLSSRTKDNGINDQIISYFKDAVNTIYQGSSAQGALETASRGVVQVLEEYGLTIQ